MAWSDLHTAPRDRAIWLFLPSAKWESDSAGRPTKVEHLTVVGSWDAKQSAWVARTTGQPVYPSLWNDAPVGGPQPDQPAVRFN